jgi:hypothetical protein
LERTVLETFNFQKKKEKKKKTSSKVIPPTTKTKIFLIEVVEDEFGV